MIGGQNTKYALWMFLEFVKIYALFWDDQMDPKSALGGPKPISRTAPPPYGQSDREYPFFLRLDFQ